MSKNQFTFNDLPEVLGELCDRIAIAVWKVC